MKSNVVISHQTETGKMKTLVLKHAREAFIGDGYVAQHWQKLNFHHPPDFSKAVAEYEQLVNLFCQFGIEINFLPEEKETTLDSIYARDASIVSDNGMILCNMGKAARRTEPAAQEKLFREISIPILGKITDPGQLEGGDVVWLDERTLAVGRGYRTNDEGISQLKSLLGDCIEEMIVVPLPHHKGPNDVFHLMSIISPLARNMALVYSPLMPVPFREYLLAREIQLVEVPDEEFATMACNVLAIAPGICLMLDGNPVTRNRLEKAGIEVYTYKGDEISRKGEGGPTCLTRPLLREA